MIHFSRQFCITVFVFFLFTRLLNSDHTQDTINHIQAQSWQTLAQKLINREFTSLMSENNIQPIIHSLLKQCSISYVGWVTDLRMNEVVYQSKDWRCYAISHDEKLIVHYQKRDKTRKLVLFDVETKKELIVPYPHEKFFPYDCAFTPDNRYLIITAYSRGCSPEIMLYDLVAQQYCAEEDNKISRALCRINKFFSKMYIENRINQRLDFQLLSVAVSRDGNYLAFVINEPARSNIEAVMYIYDFARKGLFKAKCAVKKLIAEQPQIKDKFTYQCLGKSKCVFSNDDRFVAWHSHYNVESRDASIRKIAIKAICRPSSGIFTLIEVGETEAVVIKPLIPDETGTNFITLGQNNQHLMVQKFIHENFSFEATLFILMLDKWYQEHGKVDFNKNKKLNQLFNVLFTPEIQELLCKEYKITRVRQMKHNVPTCASF